MFDFFEKILQLPGLFFSSLKAILSTIFLAMLCIALYNYAPVKEKVDPVVEKTIELTPEVIKKPMKMIVEKNPFLMQKKRSFGEKVIIKIKGIPSSFYNIFRGGFESILVRVLDAVFHPIFLIFLVLFFAHRLKKNA